MVGKFILIAFLCVSLTQVQGNELEEAIKNGLIKVKDLYESGEVKINGSIETVGYKSKTVQRKTIGFLLKSTLSEKKAKQALGEAAKAMEEKAMELNKTDAVFECIKKIEKNANGKIQFFSGKFKVSIVILEKVNLAKIQIQSKPLYDMEKAISVEYEKVVKTIQNCKTTSCVDNAVNGCAKWLDRMNDNIERVFTQVGNTVVTYEKLGSNLLENLTKQVNQIKTNGIKDINNCVSD